MPSCPRLQPVHCARNHVAWLGVLALAALAAGAPRAGAQATSSTTGVVVLWNRVLNQAIAVPGANPATTFFTRPYAIMNVAIFDAINSIEGRYHPFSSACAPPKGHPRKPLRRRRRTTRWPR